MDTLSDKHLHDEILDELTWDPRVRNQEIGIAVKDGVVTISGSIDTNSGKAAAVRAVERVAGVRAVANELKVRLPRNHERTDTDIAHSAVNMLEWSTEVPNESVRIRVEHGWIILEGTVEWHYQRLATEDAVAGLLGVKGVSNLIQVKEQIPAEVVKAAIEQAIRRTAEDDAKRIAVESSGDAVTLRGQVRSWAEREDAETAALNSGVSKVVNLIVVRGGEISLSGQPGRSRTAGGSVARALSGSDG